jgi:L-ascorbate metabolism protein UlaG (beta-lactamase superfamily)
LSKLRRILWRGFKGFLLLLLLAATVGVMAGWTGFGKRARGERRARMEKSPQWQGGQFKNPQPLHNYTWPAIKAMFDASPHASPHAPVPTVPPSIIEPEPASGLRVTWFGHSSTLIEIDGHRVLTDPMWGPRSSPIGWIGPSRWYPPLTALDALPKIDAILISHDHYDHLDHQTIVALKDRDTTFVVPLGVAAHLVYWGVPEARIRELDWWDKTRIGALDITCTPARHASGRTLIDNDGTLWAGYAIAGAMHRAFYSGDTGLFPAMKQIGEKLGPFDVTLIEIGQYHKAWPDWHIGPEQAVKAHGWLRGKVMFPIHWGLLQLAMHGWTEPAERVLAEAKRQGVTLVMPRPGQGVEIESAAASEPWWPKLSIRSGVDDPIVSTQVE